MINVGEDVKWFKYTTFFASYNISLTKVVPSKDYARWSYFQSAGNVSTFYQSAIARVSYKSF